MSDQPTPSDRDREAVLESLEHHTELPQTRLSGALEGFVRGVGNAVSWLWVVLVVVIVVNVTMRYVFGEGRIEFEELQWHLYAVGFLIGLSYCIQNDSHIRIDILHERFRLRTQAWIELFGIVFFLIPFAVIVLIYSPAFISYSWSVSEVSDAPGGLPYRWAVKSFMFIGFALVLIAGVARLLRVWSLLFGGAPPGRSGAGG